MGSSLASQSNASTICWKDPPRCKDPWLNAWRRPRISPLRTPPFSPILDNSVGPLNYLRNTRSPNKGKASRVLHPSPHIVHILPAYFQKWLLSQERCPLPLHTPGSEAACPAPSPAVSASAGQENSICHHLTVPKGAGSIHQLPPTLCWSFWEDRGNSVMLTPVTSLPLNGASMMNSTKCCPQH